VVFLVALPLSIGIAVACGVPAERGLVTGIIGGMLVGTIAGAPLLVSGPAASLIVAVFELVHTHGLVALAPVVMLAGVWQAIAGILRLGQWFRAVAPAVIHGMLIGIGILIVVSQLHVSIDADPGSAFLHNLIAFPGVLRDRLASGTSGIAPVLIAVATIGIIVGWNARRPARFKLVPGHLVALVVVTLAVLAFDSSVMFLDISPDFFAGLGPVSTGDFRILFDPSLIGLSFVFAFVASAATLLTAAAIDQRQAHSRADYDREMLAQGVGNLVTGSLGGLPMTGVIVRSSVNLDAGARTRLSAILHGVWLLVFVSIAPEVLERIPRAALGAILVYTGWRLIDVRALALLWRQGRAELGIALVTLLGVVFVDLFAGIVAGLVAAFAKIVYTFARLEIRSEPGPSGELHHVHLVGSATFVQLPRLARALESVPGDRELHVHIDRLDHIDHACLELLTSVNRRRESEGKQRLVVEWDELTHRYQHAIFGAGPRDPEPSWNLLSLVWAEWKRIYAPRNADEHAWPDWIDASRVRVHAEASTLREVIVTAATMLAPAANKPAAELERVLLARVEGHVALGEGVSIPHAPIPGLDRAHAALVTTRGPVDVAGEAADLFFVLLAPEGDPQQHLRSLAHVGRLCHDRALLAGLRNAATAQEAAELLRAAEQHAADSAALSSTSHDALLAILEVHGEDVAGRVAKLVDAAFWAPTVLSSADGGAFDAFRRVLIVPSSRRLVLLTIEARDINVMRALLDQHARTYPSDLCRLHVLRRDPSAGPSLGAT
jgi:MFS superfamily sulfate permease-like transporter/mannitol/fructose-specific phosphotransferase system IIA component (Ntr-type)